MLGVDDGVDGQSPEEDGGAGTPVQQGGSNQKRRQSSGRKSALASMQEAADESNAMLAEAMNLSTKSLVHLLSSNRAEDREERQLDREDKERRHQIKMQVLKEQEEERRRAHEMQMQLMKEQAEERRLERREEAEARRQEWMQMMQVLMKK